MQEHARVGSGSEELLRDAVGLLQARLPPAHVLLTPCPDLSPYELLCTPLLVASISALLNPRRGRPSPREVVDDTCGRHRPNDTGVLMRVLKTDGERASVDGHDRRTAEGPAAQTLLLVVHDALDQVLPRPGATVNDLNRQDASDLHRGIVEVQGIDKLLRDYDPRRASLRAFLRSRTRRRQLGDNAARIHLVTADGKEPPDRPGDLTDQQLGLLVVRKVLEAADPVAKTLFLRHQIEGEPLRQVAESLGLPDTTARRRLDDLKLRMRGALHQGTA